MARSVNVSAVLTLLASLAGAAEPDRDFSGEWRLNPTESVIRYLPFPATNTIRIEQNGNAIQCTCDGGVTYTIGETVRHAVGQTELRSVTKWEGNVLLVNTLANSTPPYTLMDRWKLSRDHRTLSIRRQYLTATGELESTLVYERAGEPPAPPAPVVSSSKPAPKRPPARPQPAEFVVEKGTRIPLVSLTDITSKQATKGDMLFMRTTAPIAVSGRIVIPKGSEVSAFVTSVKRPGRAKGRAELHLQFDSITLPNGVVRDLKSQLSDMENASVDPVEGGIKGEGNKKRDAATVGGAAGTGAGIGTMAGGRGLGTGVGAAAGAAAGLAGVLGRRGPEIVINKGAGMELILDRDLKYAFTELVSVR
jgi:type IV secretion system protein VirB10